MAFFDENCREEIRWKSLRRTATSIRKIFFLFYTSDAGSNNMKQSIQHEKVLFESFFF